MVTQGVATKIVATNLTKCAYTHPKMNVRVAAVGEITADDGTVITMPARTALQKGKRAAEPRPVQRIATRLRRRIRRKFRLQTCRSSKSTADGEVITGFIVADNYYEMYVNGKLVSLTTRRIPPSTRRSSSSR